MGLLKINSKIHEKLRFCRLEIFEILEMKHFQTVPFSTKNQINEK